MRTERLAAAAGALYVAAILIGNGLYEAGSTGADDGPGILADLQRETSPVHTFGLTLEVLGFAAFLVFLGALYRILRHGRSDAGWLAPTALGAGLVTIAVKLGSIAPVIAARYRLDDLSPELARTLMDLGNAAFVISGYTSGLFVAAAAAATLISRSAPRWLAVSGVVIGVLTVAAGTAGIVDPRGYVPVPFLLGLVWTLVLSVVLAVRRPVAADPDTTEAVPAAALGRA